MSKLKFKFDRYSLEIIYTAFIRPICNLGNCEIEKKIHLEAARISTGTTKLTFVRTLK